MFSTVFSYFRRFSSFFIPKAQLDKSAASIISPPSIGAANAGQQSAKPAPAASQPAPAASRGPQKESLEDQLQEVVQKNSFDLRGAIGQRWAKQLEKNGELKARQGVL